MPDEIVEVDVNLESDGDNEAEWALWIFAGPGAFVGLDGEGEQGPHSLAALIESCPPRVKILAEEVREPEQWERYSGEWHGARSRYEGSDERKDEGEGNRDLGSFLSWAAESSAQCKHRALVLLGDVLRAGEDPLAAAASFVDPDRPSNVPYVKIKKGSTDAYYEYQVASASYRGIKNASDVISDADMQALLGRQEAFATTKAEAGERSLEAEQAPVRTDDAVFVDPDSRPKPSLLGTGVPEPTERAQRRLAVLREALRGKDCPDLLLTDSCDVTALDHLEQVLDLGLAVVGDAVSAQDDAVDAILNEMVHR